jgi:hypothetical protein
MFETDDLYLGLYLIFPQFYMLRVTCLTHLISLDAFSLHALYFVIRIINIFINIYCMQTAWKKITNRILLDPSCEYLRVYRQVEH